MRSREKPTLPPVRGKIATRKSHVMAFDGSSQPGHTYYKYCTAIFNSALGVTCDLSAELYLPAELVVTCDQPKISADSIFGRALCPAGKKYLFLIIL